MNETRQFSVPRTTADSLREQINRSNEQSLHRKRMAENGQPPAGPDKETGRQPAAGPRPGGQRPINRAGIVDNKKENIPLREGERRSVQPQANGAPTVSAVNHHAPASSAVRPAAHPVAQGQTNRPPQGRTEQNRTGPKPQATAERKAAEARMPEAKGNGVPGSQPTPAAAPQQKAMDRTRVTDISAIQRTAGTQTGAGAAAVGKKGQNTQPKKKDEKKNRPVRTEVVYEGEGGNTIVSMVKAVVYMIFVVVISVFLAITMIRVGNDVFAFVKNDVAVDIRIPEYATLEDVTNILYEADIIEYPTVFRIYARLRHDNENYLAGDYVVSPNMNYDDLRDAFKPQPKLGISQITIPEGYTTDEIIDLMVSYGIGTREGYEDVIQNYEFDYWFLEELEAGTVSEDRIYRLDGYLFPDTYQFYNASSEEVVIDKLLKRFGQIFTKEYKIQCETMGYSVDEIISLAALIEKEAGTPSEFFKVSSVFHNRLRNKSNFPYLESDATIVYAIQHETGERPQLKDTTYETPYNTYQHRGLPPGPIANPSASAMLAALSPADTAYYYFVSDGNITYFSETKEQHNIFIQEIKNGTIASYVAAMGTEEEGIAG